MGRLPAWNFPPKQEAPGVTRKVTWVFSVELNLSASDSKEPACWAPFLEKHFLFSCLVMVLN